MPKLSLLLVAGLGLVATAAGAAPGCRTDLSTLLNAHQTTRYSLVDHGVEGPPYDISQDAVFSVGGAGSVAWNARPVAGDARPQRVFVSGLVPARARASLSETLDALPPEQLFDCTIENDVAASFHLRLQGRSDISLAVPGAEQRHLVIEYADPDASTLPSCSQEMRLLDAIITQTVGAMRTQPVRPLRCL